MSTPRSTPADKAERFRELHVPGRPLLMPNVWDPGTAKVVGSLGFAALATTSSGHAATLGRLDGAATLDEALAHAAAIAGATDLPVSADFENGFADAPDAVAANVTRAVATGLAGCSIEDFAKRRDDPIYDVGLAVERIAAAAEAAHAGPTRMVLTARAENYLHGHPDLADTIGRLQKYQEAGADVLFAPGVSNSADIGRLVKAVDRPVNVIALATVPPVAELAALGVARVSVGGNFAWVAMAAVIDAARELRDSGTYGFTAVAGPSRTVVREAFGD